MFGYATDESEEMMPLTHVLSTKLVLRLQECREQGILPWLRPDSKSQVTLEYEDRDGHLVPIRCHTIVISTQHAEDVTNEETLSKYVGHFELTPKTQGNIVLAAHNRGYPINYFEKLKNLKGGEEIIYTYKEFTKIYVVNKNVKISDIDWSYLENSSENKITLITCIENEPAYRRCVQAIEKEEN